jgi:hypothetical protein
MQNVIADHYRLKQLARRTSDRLAGTMLDVAFKRLKSDGLRLRIASLDGIRRNMVNDYDPLRVNVVVVNSVVRRSWVG